MNKIKILPPEEALKIAAGEVVERPSNIVKETLENSIDAGSTQISLYIKDSGKELIRIIDNGSGMSPDDAKLCFTTHATSKINNLNDLEQISSFGFRGEALASISSVSKVTLTTKTSNSELASQIEYSANKLISEEQVSAQTGSDLQIKELFYNTPVRKKFLRKGDTEWNQILNTFQAFCLSNLNIHFKLYKDEKLVINAPVVNQLTERSAQLWGHNFSQNMLNLIEANEKEFKQKEIKFSGIISTHNFWRYGKHQIFFFVNGRYIKDKDLNRALVKGYTGVLPPARFPAGFIFINVPNDFVDINVHPKKEEVRFLKPNTVTNYLQRLVKLSLDEHVKSLFGNNNDKNENHLQNDNITQNKTQPNIILEQAIHSSNLNLSNSNLSNTSNLGNKKEHLSDSEGNNNFQHQSKPLIVSDFFENRFNETKIRSNILRPRELEHKKEQTTIYEEENVDTRKEFKIIGQMLRTYIIAQSGEDLVLIDQHDAHERIIYDRITKNFEKKEGTRLMFPEIINLSDSEIQQIKPAFKFLSKQGIEIEFFGKNQIAIKSSPPKIQNHSLKELIFEILDFIKENENLEEEIFRKKLNDRIHAQVACKSAIKAGDKISFEQMEQIVKDLQKTSNPLTCPHGRPTTWIISKHEIEKKFKRDYK